METPWRHSTGPLPQPHGLLLAVPLRKEDVSALLIEGNVSPLSLLYLHSWLPDPGVIRGPFLEIRCSAPEWDSGKNTHAPPHSYTPTCHTCLSLLSWEKAEGQTHGCYTSELWVLVLGTAGIRCPGWALPGLSGHLASVVK